MTTKFVRIKCDKCKNEQVVFEKPASDVKCLVCGEMLVKSTGGKGLIKTKTVSPVQ